MGFGTRGWETSGCGSGGCGAAPFGSCSAWGCAATRFGGGGCCAAAPFEGCGAAGLRYSGFCSGIGIAHWGVARRPLRMGGGYPIVWGWRHLCPVDPAAFGGGYRIAWGLAAFLARRLSQTWWRLPEKVAVPAVRCGLRSHLTAAIATHSGNRLPAKRPARPDQRGRTRAASSGPGVVGPRREVALLCGNHGKNRTKLPPRAGGTQEGRRRHAGRAQETHGACARAAGRSPWWGL